MSNANFYNNFPKWGRGNERRAAYAQLPALAYPLDHTLEDQQSLTQQVAAALATYSDAGWFDPSDASMVFQERTGASATTPATNGDPVGTILDKSGNGHHLTAPSDAARPTLTVSGGLTYLDFDANNDSELSLGSYTGSGDEDFFFGMETTDGTGVIITDTSGRYIVWQNGSGSGPFGSVGSPTVLVNRSEVSSPTQNSLHDALATGTGVVLSIEGADTSAWGSLILFRYANSGVYDVTGRIHGIIRVPAPSSADAALFELWAAEKSGVTL